MSHDRGIAVASDRGIATLRITSVPGAAETSRFGADALAGLRTLRRKGLHGLLIDLSHAAAPDGAAHARLATSLTATLAEWEARGLPLAVVAPERRAALEATRVVAGAAPRWGRVVRSLDDATRYLAPT